MKHKKVKISLIPNNSPLLRQSDNDYQLSKDESKNLYYICRVKDKKVALIGTKDDAVEYICYGVSANKKELETLNFS